MMGGLLHLQGIRTWAIRIYGLFMLVFFCVPLLSLFWLSLKGHHLGRPIEGWTLENYRFLLTEVDFIGALRRSLVLSGVVSVTSVFLGIGVVLGTFATGRVGVKRYVLLACAVLFFAGVIPRAFALGYAFSGRGPLAWLWNLLGEDGLLYTEMGSFVGYLMIMLPLSVLVLYVSRQAVDPGLTAAAEDLGARWWQAQRHVVLPLMKPGLIVALILAFVVTIGDVVIVDLLGGSQTYTAGLAIVDFVKVDDWGVAAAAAVVVLLLVAIVLIAMFLWASRSIQKWVAE